MTMQLIEPLHTVKRVSRLVEIPTPAFLEFMAAGKHPMTLTDTIFTRDLACCCSQSMASQKSSDTCAS